MSRVLLIGVPNFTMHPQLCQEDELEALAESFSSFEPTAIALEKSFYLEEEVNRQLTAYKNGNFPLTLDAMEQLSFRTAVRTGMESLQMIDEIVDMTTPSLEQVFTWAEEYQPVLLKEIIGVKQNADQTLKGESLREYLRNMNGTTYLRLIHNLHASLNIVGDRHHQVGSAWLKQLYEKNLAVAANIERLCVCEEKLLVIVSDETLPAVKQLLEQSGRLSLEDPVSFF